MNLMHPLRLAAFAIDQQGGNPAGVVIADHHPTVAEMHQIAADVGYSETVFARADGDGWRVRYFSPESEVPFCGHATIALGAALADRFGDGIFDLTLNAAQITVEGRHSDTHLHAALQSPPTKSKPATEPVTEAALQLFGLTANDLDPRIKPSLANAGADHLILTLNSRATLAGMAYPLDTGKKLMRTHGLVTIALVWPASDTLFHVRNAFASGGVLEDPATGAAAAAFAGMLRDIDWPHGGEITLIQGEDMGAKSMITAQISPTPGCSIRISGGVRYL